MHWSKEKDIKTNNAMVKRKRHKKTMQWSKEKDIKTNNAMVKIKRHKDKQCNGQKKKT